AMQAEAELDALKAQEPVAWMKDQWSPDCGNYWELCREDEMGWRDRKDWVPLYARPLPPAQSVPEGWLRAIDEALIVAHIGVASAEDSYEVAKRKLYALIGFHVDVATDPAVNGGCKLMPIEPTKEILKAMCDATHTLNDHRAMRVYQAVLAAAPKL